MKEGASIKSIIVTLAANALIGIAKLVGAIITLSGSLLAEAIHSFADCANQGLLLLGLKRAARTPDEKHPLGYGKAIYFWSFIVALMLFSMGGLFSLYEGIHKMREVKPVEYPYVAIGILLFGLVLEFISLMTAVKEINITRKNESLWQWFKNTKQSELMIIFGENLAAVVGLAIALAAVVLAMLTGNGFYDGLGSAVIGVLLILIAISMGREIKSLLLGESADPAVREAIVANLLKQEGISEVLEVITIMLGQEIMVAVKCRLNFNVSADILSQKINAYEAQLKKAIPKIKVIFFEPDVVK